MTNEKLMARIIAEARARGFSTERVEMVYDNRVRLISKTRLHISGFRCYLYHLQHIRVSGEKRYAMLGITRASLRKSDFIFVTFSTDEGERLLIIPSKILLRRILKGTRFRRFYIPHHSVAQWRIASGRDINWPRYQDGWHQLVPLS